MLCCEFSECTSKHDQTSSELAHEAPSMSLLQPHKTIPLSSILNNPDQTDVENECKNKPSLYQIIASMQLQKRPILRYLMKG